MSKEYYFLDNFNNKHGPFLLGQLKQTNIKADTLIWCEGMPNWDKACNVRGLKSMFKQSPPPVPRQQDIFLSNPSQPPLPQKATPPPYNPPPLLRYEYIESPAPVAEKKGYSMPLIIGMVGLGLFLSIITRGLALVVILIVWAISAATKK
jgi:hypothetical protein